LAELKYGKGATIYNAEQSWFNAQSAYVTTQSQRFQWYANLYKAMGGGWLGERNELGGSEAAGAAKVAAAPIGAR
jgi:outer membrane protein TolC